MAIGLFLRQVGHSETRRLKAGKPPTGPHTSKRCISAPFAARSGISRCHQPSTYRWLQYAGVRRYAMENAKRLEALEAKRKQLDAQIQALRVREQTQASKDDTRRKVLIGGVMLKMVKLDEMPEGRLTQLLDKHLDAERDRKLFGLEPKQQAQP